MSRQPYAMKNFLKNKPIWLVTLLFLTLLLVGHKLSRQSSGYQEFSSQSEPKFQHKNFKLHQKLQPPIQVSILKPKQLVTDNSKLTLLAKVTSSMDTENAHIQWVLPEYIKLVSGEFETIIPKLLANQSEVVEIEVESFSEENQQIHVKASAPYGQQVLSSTAQYNTTLQDEIDKGIAELTERNKAYVQKLEE